MAKPVKLLTISDGFGDQHAVPIPWYPNYTKWPELIKLMTKNIELTNLSRYGAGNEYIIQTLKNNLIDKTAVLVQWVVPDRLDLVLAHTEYKDFWNQEIKNDSVYNNNVVLVGNDKIWITSASNTNGVREYHKKFISYRQHQIRSQLYIDYAKLLLASVQHGFLLTKTSKYLGEVVNDDSSWYWHDRFQGMCEFRNLSKYADLDFGLIQPIPLIQFDFIRQFIQPRFDLPWRSERDIQAVENMLFRKYQEAVKNKP